jgi:TolB-like protein/DNA-binding winged helix-turn-helix (wHTH) protein/tetratricopeptide (TPR) repeat protein
VSNKKFRFDGWVLDPESGDLERSGTRVRLQEQPALVLRELITHAGSVVTREHLIALLWPKGVVDFDTGVNTAIRKLRSALGDTAETPRYIETLPRRGYRFIGSVDPDPETVSAVRSADLPISAPGEGSSGAVDSAPGPGAQDESPSSVASGAAPRRRLLPNLALVAALAVAVLAMGTYAAWRAHFAASMTAVRVEAPPASALPAHTVAVLPFENLSAEPNDGFLATGIAEGVLHQLAAVKSLSVIARTSSFTFRGRDVDARDIGRKLNARYLVEGSVQRVDDRLRVTAQLLDASSGSDLWSLRFERHMGDIFEVEDEISGKVADALAVSLEPRPANSSARATPKLDAYLAYIEGRSLLSTFKIADAKAGIERLRRATEIEPTFATAYAEEAHGLRLLWWLLHPDDRPDAETEKQAAALVDKALSLDPGLGDAWVERAFGREQTIEGFDATIDTDFRKGLALAPNYAQGYELYGEWLDQIGRTDDGLAMIERARQLDPLAPRNHYKKGLILLQRGDVDGAVALFLEALRVNPTYHPALLRLGGIEYGRGNLLQAAKFFERAIGIDPGADWVRGPAVFVYLDLGDAAAAQDVISTVPPNPVVQSCISSYLGKVERAAADLYALPDGKLKAILTNEEFNDCPSAVIRDDAFARHDYGRGLRALEVCLTPEWHAVFSRPEFDARASCALRYASLLIASGDRDRAAKLLHAMLKGMEGHKPDSDVTEAKGTALALLGDTDGALEALEAGFAAQKWGWSYDFDHSPDFEALHAQPRFQSLVQQYHDFVAKQSALLAEMRRSGEVPYRPPQSATTSRN